MSSAANAPSGTQRVAAFLLSLDKASAAAVLKTLDPKIVSEVAAAMTELDHSFSDKTAIDALYRELSRTLNAPGGLHAQDEGELGTTLESALGRERARVVIAEIQQRRRIERPFSILEEEPPAVLALALAEESPVVGALVLAHLDPVLSAELISTFEPEHALDVVRRIATLIPPGFEALSSVAEKLKQRMSVLAKAPVAPDPNVRLKSIAQMLAHSENGIEKSVLEGLEGDNKEMAEGIREFMFTWTDLATVDKRGMQKILASVETRTLAVALKACSADVENNIMGNLSVRVREMVADERELAGALPMVEVLAARGELMKNVRALMESGEFKPARAGEELVK